MAYNSTTKYSGGANKSAPVAKTTGSIDKKEALFRTGLWMQEAKEGRVPSAAVQVSETLTIPAGSWINLFFNEGNKKTDKHPDFNIVVNAGVLKAKRA